MSGEWQGREATFQIFLRLTWPEIQVRLFHNPINRATLVGGYSSG